jgi:hypothetical protein
VLKFTKFIEKVNEGSEVATRRSLRSSSRERDSDSPRVLECESAVEQRKGSKKDGKKGRK